MVDNVSHTRRLLTASVLAVTAACSLLAAAPGARADSAGCANARVQIAQSSPLKLQKAVVCLVNEQRTERGLPKLESDRKLDDSAQRWTDDMVGNSDFSHGAGLAFTARISAAGFNWENAAENIATGYTTPQAVVDAWMASPGHCANILNPLYREVGTGVDNSVVRGSSTIDGTWTQDFGRLMGQRALSSNFGPSEACYR
jgi:uncharacterized protein YkwD